MTEKDTILTILDKLNKDYSEICDNDYCLVRVNDDEYPEMYVAYHFIQGVCIDIEITEYYTPFRAPL